ncbi:fungal-specific transcription factor domain-containing protein [Dichotomopilus funicola]|uniref:Fungal-specific transcription factor domain-containing protein n=1 Tax=Dichotomopilus funicola TaxID=1934379 RepID=A0AAN6V1W7_9PEZI|nr:fungal-specific transcription factor domain-containing protein [Dichotomopilus funicola]
MSDTQGSPAGDLTPEEASRIIHSHRKVRYGTACWPCRQRKVKCDNKSPCENCVKREHPQLCSYKPNRAAASKSNSVVPENSTPSRKRARSPDEQGSRSQSNEAQDTISTYEPDNTETTRYVGQNSIPALLREQTSEPQEGNGIRQDMRSLLGLDNSAPFPLMSSRHLDKLTYDISHELPSDREVMKLFRTYKEIPQQFWGFVIDIDGLESRLMVYLEDRAKNARASTKTPKPVSASWLSILFAVLAVGSQYHDSPYHIRTRDSQKYIQISFHFLRIGNFLLRPNLDSIQALLMTSFVLLNDMKAEASWALLGLTCRLAQSLGVHRAQPLDERQTPDAAKKEMARRKLWWTCLWHDTLTSLSFDRSPMTNIPCCPLPMSPTAETEGWAYLEAMFHLNQIISERLNPDAIASATYAEILDNCAAVENIRDKLKVRLRSKEMCKSAVDRLQHFAIRLHTSFIISVCCRPALLRRDSNLLDAEQKKFLADRCKANLTETVRMFLAMHQLSVIPTRSWAFTYHGLSSAVLLGILGETKADPEVRQLQGDLISALSATAAKDLTSPRPHIRKTDLDIELSGPLSRALDALRNIYDHGTVVGRQLKREMSNAGTGSGTRTPLGPAQLASLSANGVPVQDLRPGPGHLDPHQNAALAMTELQQQSGGSVADFSAGIPFAQLPATSGAPPLLDIAGYDPASYMSPMDLYDSIFWESPDPFNTGLDSMNFDFLAHPPPGQPPQQQFYF